MSAEALPRGDEGAEIVDEFGLSVRNRMERGSARQAGNLVRESIRIVRRAAGGPFVALLALTAGTAASAVGQVAVGSLVLGSLLNLDPRTGVGPVVPAALALAGLSVLGLVLGVASSQVQRMLEALVLRDVERRILDVTTSVPMDAFETPDFATTLTRVRLNALTKPAEVVAALVRTASGLLSVAGLGVVMVTIEPLLLPLLVLAALPVVVVNRQAAQREFSAAVEQAQGLRERHYLADVLTERETAKEVRAFDLAAVVRRRWEGGYAAFLAALRALVGVRIRLAVAGAAASGAAVLVTLLFLIHQVGAGHLPLAQAAAAVVAARMVSTRLQNLAAGASGLFEARLFLDDLTAFLAMAPPRRDPVPPAPMFAELTMDHVSFTYPGVAAPTLRDISLEIKRGELVALVGENGSGKSTLAKLLAGLHSPTTGVLSWDGVRVGQSEAERTRQQTTVVFQDFARFELTALENIAPGRADTASGEAAVRNAARRAGADTFVQGLPAGYSTMLSKAVPGGVDLSIGQWQRIALARALHRKGGFVVLDEPTSALDPRAEHALVRDMRELMEDRTVLLVSHRFSSVRDADRIYVLDAGEIVESGNHVSLMAAGGHYATMFALQASAYADTSGAAS